MLTCVLTVGGGRVLQIPASGPEPAWAEPWKPRLGQDETPGQVEKFHPEVVESWSRDLRPGLISSRWHSLANVLALKAARELDEEFNDNVDNMLKKTPDDEVVLMVNL
jgi:hypothetical protein